MSPSGTKRNQVVDDQRGEKLGEWICSECGGRSVVRSRSKWTQPASRPGERCSCTFCCYDTSCRPGTMSYHPVAKVGACADREEPHAPNAHGICQKCHTYC